jgi:HEAT repeat protein
MQVSQMRNPSGIDQPKQIRQLLSGDPYAAMEAAKKLIKIHEQVDPQSLISILENHTLHRWSRIAAAYVLGFLDYTRKNATARALLAVLRDPTEPVSLRSHAAEALSNLGATEAISVLRQVLHDPDESKSLRRWCEFALSELKSDDK